MAQPKQHDTAGQAPPEGPPRTESRRTALGGLVVLGSVAYAGAIAAPAVCFVTGPAESSGGPNKERWIRVGRLADIKPGEPRRVQVVGDERDAFTITRGQMLGSVWLVRDGDKVTAMSATCPHLGCSIDLGADKASFGCPCHTSQFSVRGDAQSGPSPRGMDPLATRIVDGFVEVDFRRFRTGIGERQEIGA